MKQLFVFVVAEYRSKTNPLNQVVIWDKIIEHPKDAKLKMDKATVEYVAVNDREEAPMTPPCVCPAAYWPLCNNAARFRGVPAAGMASSTRAPSCATRQ